MTAVALVQELRLRALDMQLEMAFDAMDQTGCTYLEFVDSALNEHMLAETATMLVCNDSPLFNDAYKVYLHWFRNLI